MSRNTLMTCSARSLHLLAIGWRWSPSGISHGLSWYCKPRFCENCNVQTDKVILSLYLNQQHSLRTLLCFQLWRVKCNKYIILMSHHSIYIKKIKKNWSLTFQIPLEKHQQCCQTIIIITTQTNRKHIFQNTQKNSKSKKKNKPKNMY